MIAYLLILLALIIGMRFGYLLAREEWEAREAVLRGEYHIRDMMLEQVLDSVQALEPVGQEERG